MLLLDTDHLVEYQKGTSPDSRRLKERLDSAAESYGTTIVTVEEIMRGWMAAIRRIQDVRRQVNAYTKLRRLFRFFATWRVFDWNEIAADRFDALKAAGTRTGTMDLKIASIALANDATLLTRNTNDFQGIPGLRIGNWLG
ncbi:MAG: type II toxin-antitoxin system VapC family toxin [Thermoguttaceae bacterium]|jgi:tRNA(fMet)-specific endonuclease VapC|nr:type II toxin-antitoxin system VapC family toxin [Thermoguttaceae bacterium]